MKRATIFLIGLGAALPLSAAPNVAVKCGANTDRVWVYNNLTTFDVGQHLKCGADVALLGVEKGYVKIRTEDGAEGYVTADAIPADEAAALASAAAEPTPASASVSVRAQQQVAVASSTVPASQPVTVTATVAAAPAPEQKPAPVYAAASDTAPIASIKPAVSSVAAPVVTSRTQETALPASAASPTFPAVAASAPPSTEANAFVAATVTPESGESLLSSARVVRAADLTVVRHPGEPKASRTPEYSDEDNTPEFEAPVNQFTSCNVYFSAYGVTPMQFKWISDDLKKRFPGVCPAPEPKMVDYVVIFTHDMDYFTTTLPEPVHTDQNGFSDWSPVTSVDSTQISASLLDRAHREYAWVFRVHRGTFDPGNFTSRRKPQFTKTESHSSKTIEDAMDFIAQAGPGQ